MTDPLGRLIAVLSNRGSRDYWANCRRHDGTIAVSVKLEHDSEEEALVVFSPHVSEPVIYFSADVPGVDVSLANQEEMALLAGAVNLRLPYPTIDLLTSEPSVVVQYSWRYPRSIYAKDFREEIKDIVDEIAYCIRDFRKYFQWLSHKRVEFKDLLDLLEKEFPLDGDKPMLS